METQLLIIAGICFPILDLYKLAMNMMPPKLQDDLLNDFREQKKTLNEQIELFDPLATSMRRPAAQRLMSKGGLIFAEILAYLLCIAMVALTVMMNLIYPFGPLQNVQYIKSIDDLKHLTEAEYFSITVHAMPVIISVLFFVVARIVRSIRLKNDILDLAGKNIKTLVGQHLRRKASIEAIEQRHFLELPGMEESVNVNMVRNPGY